EEQAWGRPGLRHHRPASDVERYPGDPRRGIRGQEQGGVSDVFGNAQPAERIRIGHLALPVRGMAACMVSVTTVDGPGNSPAPGWARLHRFPSPTHLMLMRSPSEPPGAAQGCTRAAAAALCGLIAGRPRHPSGRLGSCAPAPTATPLLRWLFPSSV